MLEDPAPSLVVARIEVLTTRDSLVAAFGRRHFTPAQAAERGVSHRQLRSAVEAGFVRRRRRGYYAIESAHPVAPQDRSVDHEELLLDLNCHVAELRRLGHRPVVAGKAAAELWGIPMVGQPPASTPTFIVASAPHVRRGRRGGVLIREAFLPESHITNWRGLEVTVPLRTVTDLVRLTLRSRESALSALIGAARAHLDHVHGFNADPHAITEFAQQHRIHVAIQQALQEILHDSPKRGQGLVKGLMPLIDPRIETPLESCSWLRMNTGELPLMEPQVEVVGASGRRYRVDFLRDNVVGEADGAVKYHSQEILWQEKLRQADLEAAGYIVVRWTWEEIFSKPQVVAHRLNQALSTSRRLRDSSGRLAAS